MSQPRHLFNKASRPISRQLPDVLLKLAPFLDRDMWGEQHCITRFENWVISDPNRVRALLAVAIVTMTNSNVTPDELRHQAARLHAASIRRWHP